MREIKFRAWDKNDKRIFIDPQMIDFYNKKIGYMQYQTEYMPDTSYSIPVGFEEFEYSELMQYTGLKDMREKEIYEGDIVRFYPQAPRSEELPNPRYGEMGEIFFDIGSFAVRPIDKKREVLEFFLNELGDWVVVGNIYENKELVNE